MVKKILITALFFVALGAHARPQQKPLYAPSGKEKFNALAELPDFEFSLYNNKNKLVPLKLSTLRKENKILIIDFWATWCGPCRQSIPELIAIHNEYKNRGVEVIGLSIEEPAEMTRRAPKKKNSVAVIAMANELGINYRVGFAPEDMFKGFVYIDGIPQTFIFDRNGVLIRQVRGFHPELAPKIWRTTIEALLQQDEQKKSAPSPASPK